MNYKKIFSLITPATFSSMLSATPLYKLEGLTVEAAPESLDVSANGEEKEITFVNADFSKITFTNSLSIFTSGNTSFVSSGTVKSNVAIIVDEATMKVKQVLNKAPSPDNKPAFNESTNITPEKGEFVILACDDSYASAGYKKYLATNFNVGDVIKIKKDGSPITINQLLNMCEQNLDGTRLELNYSTMFTTTDSKTNVSGNLVNYDNTIENKINIKKYNKNNSLIDEYYTYIDKTGNFSFNIPLSSGTNYIDVIAIADNIPLEDTLTSMVVYRLTNTEDKEIIMWADQFSNSKIMNTVENIERVMDNAKNAGVTAIAFDVKGPEGYAAYKKATITNTPYLTETKNPAKQFETEIDILEEVVKAAHDREIKLYASFNFFTEGNIAANDSPILDLHPDWEEIVQYPEDKGELKKVSESSKQGILKYVNPANQECVKFQLDRVKEVLDNYNVDGVVMDRTRYDNIYADFSDVSKTAFEQYLSKQGKTLNNWPDDAFKITKTGEKIDGPLYLDWLSFRASVIKNFADKLSNLVHSYEGKKLSAYVGCWYDTIYQQGLNWASDSFEYNERLNFSLPELYSADYANQNYLDDLDFIMFGTYFNNSAAINEGATIGNIVTNGEIPVYASIDITMNSKTAEQQREHFKAAYNASNGCMIFDMAVADWNKITCAINDIEYVKLDIEGVYNPK